MMRERVNDTKTFLSYKFSFVILFHICTALFSYLPSLYHPLNKTILSLSLVSFVLKGVMCMGST